ncbi:hypothetical protein HFP72_26700 [Nocardiopsis sp. ARC36]
MVVGDRGLQGIGGRGRVGVGRFREQQGTDLCVVPRLSAEDLVTGALRGLERGEVVCAPGVEDATLLDRVFEADLAAFGGQGPELPTRCRAG